MIAIAVRLRAMMGLIFIALITFALGDDYENFWEVHYSSEGLPSRSFVEIFVPFTCDVNLFMANDTTGELFHAYAPNDTIGYWVDNSTVEGMLTTTILFFLNASAAVPPNNAVMVSSTTRTNASYDSVDLASVATLPSETHAGGSAVPLALGLWPLMFAVGVAGDTSSLVWQDATFDWTSELPPDNVTLNYTSRMLLNIYLPPPELNITMFLGLTLNSSVSGCEIDNVSELITVDYAINCAAYNENRFDHQLVRDGCLGAEDCTPWNANTSYGSCGSCTYACCAEESVPVTTFAPPPPAQSVTPTLIAPTPTSATATATTTTTVRTALSSSTSAPTPLSSAIPEPTRPSPASAATELDITSSSVVMTTTASTSVLTSSTVVVINNSAGKSARE
jgi:hypothetical protein